MSDYDPVTKREPGPQPDPMLNEGPANSGKKWAVLGAVAAIAALTVFGISHKGNQPDTPPAATTGTVTLPQAGGGTNVVPSGPPVAQSPKQ